MGYDLFQETAGLDKSESVGLTEPAGLDVSKSVGLDSFTKTPPTHSESEGDVGDVKVLISEVEALGTKALGIGPELWGRALGAQAAIALAQYGPGTPGESPSGQQSSGAGPAVERGPNPLAQEIGDGSRVLPSETVTRLADTFDGLTPEAARAAYATLTPEQKAVWTLSLDGLARSVTPEDRALAQRQFDAFASTLPASELVAMGSLLRAPQAPIAGVRPESGATMLADAIESSAPRDVVDRFVREAALQVAETPALAPALAAGLVALGQGPGGQDRFNAAVDAIGPEALRAAAEGAASRFRQDGYDALQADVGHAERLVDLMQGYQTDGPSAERAVAQARAEVFLGLHEGASQGAVLSDEVVAPLREVANGLLAEHAGPMLFELREDQFDGGFQFRDVLEDAVRRGDTQMVTDLTSALLDGLSGIGRDLELDRRGQGDERQTERAVNHLAAVNYFVNELEEAVQATNLSESRQSELFGNMGAAISGGTLAAALSQGSATVANGRSDERAETIEEVQELLIERLKEELGPVLFTEFFDDITGGWRED